MIVIKACPVCGGTEIEQSYIRESLPPVESFKMTCKNCGWKGTPLEFDSELAYDQFYKELKNKRKLPEKTEDEAWHEAISYIDKGETQKRKRRSLKWKKVHTGVFIIICSVFLSFFIISYLTYEKITITDLLFFLFLLFLVVINTFGIYYLGLIWFPILDFLTMRKKLQDNMDMISTQEKIQYLWLSTILIAGIGGFIIIFGSMVVWYFVSIPFYIFLLVADMFLLFILVYSAQKTRELKNQ